MATINDEFDLAEQLYCAFVVTWMELTGQQTSKMFSVVFFSNSS